MRFETIGARSWQYGPIETKELFVAEIRKRRYANDYDEDLVDN